MGQQHHDCGADFTGYFHNSVHYRIPVLNKDQQQQQDLMADILSFKYDPLGFVMYAYPWGKKGTPLEKMTQPRRWQIEEFENIREKLEHNRGLIRLGLEPGAIYVAVSSGRGPGKSAFLAMLDGWFMSCWIGGTEIKTANTETQLRSRTMAEQGKWHTMMINAHWFDKTSMRLVPKKWFAELVREQLKIDTQYYYCEGQSWSDENPDAFAGAHSQIGMMVQYDEASGIPDSIWVVTDGFFTDLAECRLWVVISNPRRNTGRFYDCFHKDKHLWMTRYVDSRTVEGIDLKVYQRIADKYGEDHDVTRVEVKGEFPRTGSNQFIGVDDCYDAAERELLQDYQAPKIMGGDIARYGDDECVIRFRQGRDGRTHRVYRWKGENTMTTATKIANIIEKEKPDAVFIDGGGVGGGVVDRLHQLGYNVIEVQSGGSAEDKEMYLNKRAEMAGEARAWLQNGGCIANDGLFIQDAVSFEYEVTLKGQIKLETKESMKKRGVPSTNDFDAFALTFAQPVASIELIRRRSDLNIGRAIVDYDILGL